jgi:predicted MFS family arabinose efflux permease
MFALRLLPATPPAARAFSFDWLGLGLFALFVAPTILALDQARRLATGPLLLAAALLLFAAIVLVLLWRWQRRAPDPLLPLAVLTEPTVWRANLIAALVGGAYVGCIAFLPIYFVAVRGASALGAGIALLPLAVTSAIGATMAGRLLVRTGRGMLWPAIGLGFAAALLAVLALSVGGLSALPLGVLLGLVALGFGTSFPMVQLTVQAAVPRERLGTATASVQFIRSLGAATGTALLGAVLFGALVAAGSGAAELFVALVDRGPEALAALDPAAGAAFQSSLIAAFRAVFLTAAALVATAAWVCTRVPLQRF